MNDRLNTYIAEGRQDAAEQKRQGNLKQAMLISLGVIIAVVIIRVIVSPVRLTSVTLCMEPFSAFLIGIFLRFDWSGVNL